MPGAPWRRAEGWGDGPVTIADPHATTGLSADRPRPRKPAPAHPDFLGDCRGIPDVPERFNRFQRLRVTNLHRKIFKKSKIGLLEVKLEHKVQNILGASLASQLSKRSSEGLGKVGHISEISPISEI